MNRLLPSIAPSALRRPGIALCIWLTSALLVTAQAAQNRLESVQAVALSADKVAITLTLSGPAPEPSIFTVAQPARLSLDLPNTDLAVAQRYREIEAGPVQGLALAAGANRTRLVVELDRLVPYNVTREGRQIRLLIGAGVTAGTSPSTTPGYGAVGAARPSAAGNSVADVDFRRGDNGAGRIEVTVAGLSGPVDINEDDGRIIATLPDTNLPDALEKRLDVLDFATSVKYIDIFERGGDTRIVVTPIPGAEYEQLAYQSGNQFILELQPLTPAETEQRQTRKPVYEGEKISLSFQSVDVRAVLQIIADVADVNMVVSDSVSGTIALRLENVPWDQALDIILRAKGLGMRRIGNVISVAPLPEIAAREQAELAAYQATRNLAPLRSEIIQINYARAADIAALLQSVEGAVPLLSERGRVTVDERTNSLLISETATKLREIRRLIERLDVPIRQVLIEARIVIANREFSRQLGVNLAATDQAAIGNIGGNKLVNSGFTVNLPTPIGGGTLSTSIIGDTFNLDLALSALESENRGEIISSPRIITADGQEASIEQGVEIPYLEAAASGAATVEFKEAVLSLTVTPQVTPDERVIMSLFVTQDSQGDSISVQGGGSVPSINTRSLTTQVLVEDGDTVVLGGIYQQENRNQQTQIPFLGDIPLIGALFSGTTKEREKRELLIFITPKILRETLTAR